MIFKPVAAVPSVLMAPQYLRRIEDFEAIEDLSEVVNPLWDAETPRYI